MNTKQINMSTAEPQLPPQVKQASRNHGGMTVPDDFFMQFERKMNAVIDAAVLAEGQQPTVLPKVTKTHSQHRGLRWVGVAAGLALVLVVGAALRFEWFQSQPDVQTQQFIAESADEELNPADDVYYTSLSDYEVFDLICGL